MSGACRWRIRSINCTKSSHDSRDRRLNSPQPATLARRAAAARANMRCSPCRGAPVAWSIGQRRRSTRAILRRARTTPKAVLKICQELFRLVPERVEREGPHGARVRQTRSTAVVAGVRRRWLRSTAATSREAAAPSREAAAEGAGAEGEPNYMWRKPQRGG